MIKTVMPGDYDWSEPQSVLIDSSMRGLDGGQLQKRAAAGVFKGIDVAPEKNTAIVHLIAMGDSEVYSGNRNGDIFYGHPCEVEFPEPKNEKRAKVECGNSTQLWTWTKHAKLFRDHLNKATDKSYGKVIKAAHNKNMSRVELLVSVPTDDPVWHDDIEKLASGGSLAFSMSCRIKHDICNICGNKASKKAEYCFVPNTQVTMHDGTVRSIQNIRAGDTVLSADGVPTRVLTVFVREVDEDIVWLRTSINGFSTGCTKNHPILCLPAEAYGFYDIDNRNGSMTHTTEAVCNRPGMSSFLPKPAFVSAGHLSPRDFVFSPYHSGGGVADLPYEVDEEFAWVCGLFVAEGSYSKVRHKDGTRHVNSVQFTLHRIKDRQHINRLRTFMHNRFGVDLKEYPTRNSLGTSCRVHSTKVGHMLYELCGEYAHSKHFHEGFFSAPEPIRRAFIRGILDGDGCEYDLLSEGAKYTRINSASCNLISRLRYMLAQLGYASYTAKYLNVGGPTNRTNKLPAWYLSCGYDAGRKCRAGLGRLGNYTVGYITSYEVEKYTGTVYNIETEHGTYVANDLAVHNCDHIKHNVTALTKSGHRVGMINDHMIFFDISRVRVPADRIAYSLMKVANYSTDDLRAQHVFIPPTLTVDDDPYNIFKTKESATLRKLSEIEKRIEAQGSLPMECAAIPAADLPGLPDALKTMLGDDRPRVGNALAALADVKVTLSLPDFAKIVLGPAADGIRGSINSAADMLPGVFTRMLDGGDDMPESIMPAGIDALIPQRVLNEITANAGGMSLADEPVARRMTVTIIRANKKPEIKKQANVVDDMAKKVLYTYAAYKTAWCERNGLESQATKRAVLQHYISC